MYAEDSPSSVCFKMRSSIRTVFVVGITPCSRRAHKVILKKGQLPPTTRKDPPFGVTIDVPGDTALALSLIGWLTT